MIDDEKSLPKYIENLFKPDTSWRCENKYILKLVNKLNPEKKRTKLPDLRILIDSWTDESKKKWTFPFQIIFLKVKCQLHERVSRMNGHHKIYVNILNHSSWWIDQENHEKKEKKLSVLFLDERDVHIKIH